MSQKKFENKILQKSFYRTKKVNEVITYNQSTFYRNQTILSFFIPNQFVYLIF